MAAVPVLFVEGQTLNVLSAATATNNMKGLFLSDYELTILQQVFVHRMVEASKVHVLFQVEKPTMKPNSITNRLAKLVSYKILKRKQSDTKSIRFRKYYYCIGEVGYEILKQYNSYPMGAYAPKEWRIPKLHNENSTNAIIEAYRLNRLREKPFNIRYERGSHHELIRERVSVKDWVIPDYILQIDNLLMCIEYDMGTEPVSRITEKSEKYAAMYETLQGEGYRLAVLYLTVGGIEGKVSVRRIQSMKSAHETIYSQVKHIPIYVTDESELYTLIEKLCTGTYPYRVEQSISLLSKSELLERMNNQQSKALRANSVELETLLLEQKDALLFPDEFVFRADQFYEHRGTIKTVVYCPGEIGSVQTYIHLRNANSIFAKTNESLLMADVRPIELLVTYEDVGNELLMKEVLGIQPRLDIRLQTAQEVQHSLNLLINNQSANDLENVYGVPVQRLKYVSAFKMVWEEHK